jgi:alpha-tubulin suppressor-like RCC1 family protein
MLSGVVAMAAGFGHNLAAKVDGSVWTWGFNSNGQLGDGTTNSRSIPFQVGGPAGIVSVAAGGAHSFCLAAGTLGWAWGKNSDGQLGIGSVDERHTPVQINFGGSQFSPSAGNAHSMFVQKKIDTAGFFTVWGDNAYGQLGFNDDFGPGNSTNYQDSSVRVVSLASRYFLFTAVTAGGNHSVGIPLPMAGRFLSSGVFFRGQPAGIFLWGQNNKGQLGNGTTAEAGQTTPTVLDMLPKVVGIAAGSEHTLALLLDGTVWAWGDNSAGQLGDQTTTDQLEPVQVRDFPVTDGDPDLDGLPTWKEFELGLYPGIADTNGDGIPDGLSFANGINPFFYDSDADGLSDAQDAFPFDPTRQTFPPGDPNDHTPPIITLLEPANAILLP